MVKTLLWRIIGIIWTWIGAYLIILFIPEKYKGAAMIATLIVIYHHSTRMIMYYFYERIWTKIEWGHFAEVQKEVSLKTKIAWAIGIVIMVSVILYVLIYVSPLIKGK
ncbi:MAG: DUF2061 domain-containing protein [Cyclobacteriaceae bacterium]|nr:DUF2061 domain-containing protein [Cyclobacteriaceae bacterium]